MGKEIKFLILQASVVFNRQMSLFDEYEYEDNKEGRNKAFRDTIKKVQDRRVIKISPRITEYILVFKSYINDDLVYCQLAKRTNMDTYKLQEDGIEKNVIESYPPLDVFINLRLQQFAVELNSTILSIAVIEANIRNLINSISKTYTVFINAVQEKKEFWDLIQQEDEIQEISFDMIVPNFFNATGEANELVASAKNNLNADSVELSIKNKHGKLKADLSAIDSYVRYSSLTGAWKLKIKQKGQTKYKSIHSNDVSLKKTIDNEILNLIKKSDNNLRIGTEVYNELVKKLDRMFENEY